MEQDIERTIVDLCARARKAARIVAPMGRAQKDAALRAIARGLRAGTDMLVAENVRDVAAAREKGMSYAMLDRLALDAGRVAQIAESVDEIAELHDPVGDVIADYVRPSGIRVRRLRAPLGVVAMVYESRPNVTADASALCLKAGNAVVLRGGSEARFSNAAIAAFITSALEETGLPRDAVQVIPFTDREAVRILVQQSGLIDLAIPRGGEALIRFVTENARVPVVQHFKGVCHLFLDADADLAMATALAVNGKSARPSACNAIECLLVDVAGAERLLPSVARALAEKGCELRGDARTRELVPSAKAAVPSDFGQEFGDNILAVRVVDGLSGALAHIAEFGSGHTEAICTANVDHAERFRREVDAACVAVNASTRFHDGGELGLGAEIGIATSRLHWRGPMGLESLTTMKWVVDGHGETR